jgi:hypothetical protein
MTRLGFRRLAYAATVLAGSHMASFVQPSFYQSGDEKPQQVPIQDMYGYYGGQYGYAGRAYPNYGSRYYPRGQDYYGAQGYGNYDYGGADDMTVGRWRELRERRYRYRGGYNNPPWMGNGW